ncbi:hypothetical protein C5Y41_23395 [Rahnella variigena]|uniref:hypothetical protein n=1 Tax=Rahnella variigena TaxID=574964 RepID=UPI00101D1D67|nr:hypothetical protein [Rahnella variigena]RYJ12422.1 hypothetical protein C5Y41_23395 [Rahnella variigena]
MDEKIKFSKLKEFLPLLSSFSLLTTLCPILIIWFYLNYLGRLEIFLDAISFPTLLLVIFFFFLFSFLLFSIFIFIGSLLLVAVVSQYKDNLLPHEKIKNKIVKVCFLNSISTNALIFLSLAVFYDEKSNTLLFFSVALTLSFLTSYLISYVFLMHKKHHVYGGINLNEEYLGKFTNKLITPIILMTPAMLLLIPLIFFIIQSKFSESVNLRGQFITLAFFSFLFSVFTLLPGVVFINESKQKNKIYAALISLLPLPFLIFILSIFIPPLPFIMVNATLTWAGVNDWRVHQYSISNTYLPHAMLPSINWDTRRYEEINDRYFISGVNAFSLGAIRLICPPNVLDSRGDFNKFSPFDTQENIFLKQDINNRIMQCFTIEKENIKQWDISLPSKINFEKIRISDTSSHQYKISQDELGILMLKKPKNI